MAERIDAVELRQQPIARGNITTSPRRDDADAKRVQVAAIERKSLGGVLCGTGQVTGCKIHPGQLSPRGRAKLRRLRGNLESIAGVAEKLRRAILICEFATCEAVVVVRRGIVRVHAQCPDQQPFGKRVLARTYGEPCAIGESRNEIRVAYDRAIEIRRRARILPLPDPLPALRVQSGR